MLLLALTVVLVSETLAVFVSLVETSAAAIYASHLRGNADKNASALKSDDAVDVGSVDGREVEELSEVTSVSRAVLRGQLRVDAIHLGLVHAGGADRSAGVVVGRCGGCVHGRRRERRVHGRSIRRRVRRRRGGFEGR